MYVCPAEFILSRCRLSRPGSHGPDHLIVGLLRGALRPLARRPGKTPVFLIIITARQKKGKTNQPYFPCI